MQLALSMIQSMGRDQEADDSDDDLIISSTHHWKGVRLFRDIRIGDKWIDGVSVIDL